jgi:serine/threonine-protein kinase
MTQRSLGRISPYHTVSGVHAVQAIIAQSMRDYGTFIESFEAFLRTSDGDCDNLDLTLGRSSILVGCALLLEALRGLPPLVRTAERESALVEFGNRTVTSVWAHLNKLPEIAACEDPGYIGIAHGWAGLCLSALMWSGLVESAVPDDVQTRLDQLARLAEPYGRGIRWPIKAVSRGRSHNYLTSWCNGAPGHVHLWTAAASAYGSKLYAELAEKAAWCTWEYRDNLGSICCGYAGRAYALLNQYRFSDDVQWLDRARELCRLAQVSEFEPNVSNSLYKGDLGVAVLCSDLDAPDQARQPFFELEG